MSGYEVHENICVLKGTPLVLVTAKSIGKLGVFDTKNNTMVVPVDRDFIFPEKDGKVLMVSIEHEMNYPENDYDQERKEDFSLLSWNGKNAVVEHCNYPVAEAVF